MNRRNFLRSAGTVSLPLAGGLAGIRAAPSGILDRLLTNADTDRVLVLIQLAGGNDGLNTLVPLDQLGNLQTVRPRIVLPKSSILQLKNGSSRGFHPRMSAFRDLYRNGRLSIVQSVGYPNQNRSHFRSTDIWSTASPHNVDYTTGWMARYLQRENPNYPEGYPNTSNPHPLAISMGNAASDTCQGRVTNFSQTVNDPTKLQTLSVGGNTPLPKSIYGKQATFLRIAISQTDAYGTTIKTAAERGASTAEYPTGRFAEQLKNVATLIGGGLETKVYVVHLGGFDTHASQVYNKSTEGRHADLLGQLSEGIAAFQRDIDRRGLADRVLGMTYSEFGRQIAGNGSNGTDHGDAAPLFVFGGCASNSVIGENPKIDRQLDRGEAVPMQYDFRDVYGSVLMDWFGVSRNEVKEILFPNFRYLPVANGCGSSARAAVDELSLDCQGEAHDIRVRWQTIDTSTGQRGFEVERSTDGKNFDFIGYQPATANGRKNGDYTYVDEDVREGQLYYYRLRKIGPTATEDVVSTIATGRLANSAIAELTVGLPYPNPVVDHTTIKVYAPTDSRVQYAVYDLGGRRLLQDSQSLVGRRDNLVEIRTGRLTTGQYSIQLQIGARRIGRKISVR